MRSLGGLILLAGVGVGLFVYLPAPVDNETSLHHVQRVAATNASRSASEARAAAMQRTRTRTFSPSISLASLTQADTQSGSQGSWRTTAVASDASSATLQPTSPENRYQLVVELQEQLKRVGCYYGRVDGSWGRGSKYAMQSFMERVNAALPSDEPDHMLLMLLKGQSGQVCGACPSDQLVSANGRCMPRSTIAYGRGDTGTTPEPTASSATLPWQSQTTTTTAAAEPAVKPLFTPLPTSTVSTEPLPGRMTIGGPKELPPVNSVYAPQPVTANGTTTAIALDADAGAPAEVASPKPAKTYKKRSRRREGPGTPRYNLMLSLGGVY